MAESTFLFEKNGFLVSKIKVHGMTYYVATKDKKRYIRKSLKVINQLVE